MKAELSPELLSRLDTIASKLGVTATHLWSILVHQATIEARQDLLIAGIWIALTIFCVLCIRRFFKTPEPRTLSEDPIVAILCGIVAMIGILISLLYACTAWTEFGNPEYWAFHKILELVK